MFLRIFVGIPWRGASNDSGWLEPVIFSNFGRHIFGTFRAEASIIMRRHKVPYRLSSDPKMLDLERPSDTILR